VVAVEIIVEAINNLISPMITGMIVTDMMMAKLKKVEDTTEAEQ
jgi:hypothetical protein